MSINNRLISAIEKKDTAMVRRLIEQGADVNMMNVDGNEYGNEFEITPLYVAYDNRSPIELIKILIDAGANLEIKYEEGYTLLMHICQQQYTGQSHKERKYDIDVFNLFIRSGANVNVQDNDGRTPLMVVSESGLLPFMKVLIDSSANVNMQTNDGITALMNSVIYLEQGSSNIHALKMLMNAGADPNIENDKGKNAIDYAFDIENVELRNEVLKLLNYTPIYIDTSKTVENYDPIEMTTENINIGEYIKKDRKNVVIQYNNDKYFFTNRDIIDTQENDATVYPCKQVSTSLLPRKENVMDLTPFYDLKKIGLLVPFCNMILYNENTEQQLFAIINTNKSYPSFVSARIFNGTLDYLSDPRRIPPPNVSSGLHCQGGQESQVTKIVFAEPQPRVGGGKNKNKKLLRVRKTFKRSVKAKKSHTKRKTQHKKNRITRKR